ncbi:RHS repeat domain-containing protein [Pseudomonas putida]|uniref:RHS repeat protein n=1 Tax=Pseudomonas putida TaxID=303 RepID=A0A6I6XFH4_PSEPU|nr:RHS repeat domain-containing protein [Pseudomonas putida]QHG64127.1 RHS repeat protein [Pseudomonas putida]
MSTTLFRETPSVTVIDNRGLSVREIAYQRHPDSLDSTDVRITRHSFSPNGFLMDSADPRLHSAAQVNFKYFTTHIGTVLRTISTDAGTTMAVNNTAERPLVVLSNLLIAGDNAEDASQAVIRRFLYEAAPLSGRLLAVTQGEAGVMSVVAERFLYAGGTQAEQSRNIAGQCVKHYDTAGLVQTGSVALSGGPASITRRLLKEANNSDTVVDWQGASEEAWQAALNDAAYTTLTAVDATSAVLNTTDAAGNQQQLTYDLAGSLSGTWLTLKGGMQQAIVRSIEYSAASQKLSEELGNGVVKTYTYEMKVQRLAKIKAERPVGHVSGARVLQDLRYAFDPVGNVLSVRNHAEAIHFWRNQKVVPESKNTYDSLYQLIHASGREKAGSRRPGSHAPSATLSCSAGPCAYTNYAREYTYDRGGNLTQIRHSAVATTNSYSIDITISDRSNRGVLSTLAEKPADVEPLFTVGGQQLRLQPGQNLTWTARNELLRVSPVVRGGEVDDSESYRYAASSQRVLKVTTQKNHTSVLVQRVVYLPGLELRTALSDGAETQRLHVIAVGGGRHTQVRVLQSQSAEPDGIVNGQVRYSCNDIIGSCGLEVDGDGKIFSMEVYYPYGGTAVWAARSTVESDYKTIRYSGKERDATGLYYYGWRYYQSWAGRWLSADPASTVDGLNLFRMCRNNPASYWDEQGLSPQAGNEEDEKTLTDFFSEDEVKEHILVADELKANDGYWVFRGLRFRVPFVRRDKSFYSVNKIQSADYPVKGHVLYRAHFGAAEDIARDGVRRNVGVGGEESFDDYLVALFEHTAGSGSDGRVLSLSSKKSVSKKFMSDSKVLVSIRADLYSEPVDNLFISTPQLILQHGARLFYRGKIDYSTLLGAIKQLNSKEHEFFYVGKGGDGRYGEIAPDKITVHSRSSQATLRSKHKNHHASH